MQRREFLKTLALGITGWGITPEVMAKNVKIPSVAFSNNLDTGVKDYTYKMKNFDKHHKDDVHIDDAIYKIFDSTVIRLRRLQEFAGHGNFQILSFDDGLKIARKYSQVGEFSKSEIKFMEMIFYVEAQHYGFLDQKPLKKITDQIRRKEVIKVTYTGNYLYNGLPLETYKNIKQQVGEQVILTSGVRGVMKQFLLFLNKAYKHNGNLSLASRSLAPPGYSFHGNGDFDVGQVGFGTLNFTERFTTTKVYKRLSKLGYLKLRYPQQNLLGVRFEPWHIKTNIDV
jgi:hypothetical protein